MDVKVPMSVRIYKALVLINIFTRYDYQTRIIDSNTVTTTYSLFKARSNAISPKGEQYLQPDKEEHQELQKVREELAIVKKKYLTVELTVTELLEKYNTNDNYLYNQWLTTMITYIMPINFKDQYP